MQRAFRTRYSQTLDDIAIRCDWLWSCTTCKSNREANQEWSEITEKVLRFSTLRAKRNSSLFHAPYVIGEGTDGSISVPMAMAWQRVKSQTRSSLFFADAPGFHLIPEMNPLRSEPSSTRSPCRRSKVRRLTSRCGIAASMLCHRRHRHGNRHEPTVRQGSDLGYIPVVVTDACGSGIAMRQSVLLRARILGRSLLTNVETICAQFRRIQPQQAVVRACRKPNSVGSARSRSTIPSRGQM